MVFENLSTLTLRRFYDYSAYLIDENDERWDDFDGEDVVPLKQVKEHCLDKQQVVEALRIIERNYHNPNKVLSAISDMKQELGLE